MKVKIRWICQDEEQDEDTMKNLKRFILQKADRRLSKNELYET